MAGDSVSIPRWMFQLLVAGLLTLSGYVVKGLLTEVAAMETHITSTDKDVQSCNARVTLLESKVK